MIKAIAHKKLDLTDVEYKYYNELVEQFSSEETGASGEIYFKDLFETDDDGRVVAIQTRNSIPWAILLFIQQVSINQRLRLVDSFDERLKRLENNK